MKTLNNTFRDWLLKNDYADIAKIIDEILLDWKKRGVQTRRNWWDILAGDKNGNSRNINGRQIPVLKAAQVRQGVKITKNAICKNEDELKSIPTNK
jgi:hypothetical protein